MARNWHKQLALGWVYLFAIVCTAVATPARYSGLVPEQSTHGDQTVFAPSHHAGEIELVHNVSVLARAHYSTVKKWGYAEISSLISLPERPGQHTISYFSIASPASSLHLALLFPSHYFW